MTTARAVWSSLLVQWRLTQARALMKYVLWIGPFIYAGLGAFILRLRGEAGIEYAVIGAGLVTLWEVTVWTSGTDIIRERWMGNFEYLIISPVGFFWSTLGKNLGNLILGLISTGIGFLVSRFVYGIPVVIYRLDWFLLALLATIFSFLSLALCMATVVSFSRQSVSLMNGMSYPIYILAGLMFPLDLLPGWTTPLSRALPLTWARQAMGATTVTSGAADRFWTAIIWMIGLGAAYWLLAFYLFQVVDRKVRQKGELA